MILEDLHTHTTYCDGKNSPEDMVKEAIKKRLKTIGFSGHMNAPQATYCMTVEATAQYIKEINELKKKYEGKIRILCGIEADLFSEADTSQFDYVIGSVHDIKPNGEYMTVDYNSATWREGTQKHFGGDFYAAAEMYFESVVECIKKFKPQIIGHFDLLTKFLEKDKMFDETHPRYVAAYQKAVDELVGYGIPFEINSGAISRGFRTTPYPNFEILKYIAKKGGKVIYTGDTHAKENLCCKFEEFKNLAYDAGFDYVCNADDILALKENRK